MLFFDGLRQVPPAFGPSAVTIGKFDGLHLGHRGVIGQLRELAGERGLQSVVVTFDRNPLSLLRPEACPPALVSNAQKVELLADAGVDATLMLAFDEALSRLTPREFADRVLVGALHAQVVLCGADFRFGAGGAGDLATLRELGAESGFDVVLIDDVRVDGVNGEHRVSSSEVRSLLAQGRVREVAGMLGRPARIRSTVVPGDQLGRELGYPTANLDPDLEGLLPADGVYACWAVVDGRRYGAAVSIGNNPTFDGVPAHQVEAHLFDQSIDLYGSPIELEYIDYVRPMLKFGSVDKLVATLRQDDRTIRPLLRKQRLGV